ncbi:MAG: hypothetical protein KF791_18090 [Verrucomicrobiae bacterium]|nr:hypothetical protein [Verrucomicrobiae bacterium]
MIPVPARHRVAAAAALALAAGAGMPAQEFLDRVEEALDLSTHDGRFRVQFSTISDLEGYVYQDPPPGLIYGDTAFVNPRLRLFGEAQFGEQWYAFAQFQANRGFDPRSEVRDAQFFEYLLRWTPAPSGVANFQFGQFATSFGSWVRRHYSWDSPFVTAPTPYEHVLTISDTGAPASLQAFLNRKAIPANKNSWVPLIWGPSYTSGGSFFGSVDRFDYAVEVKNAALSSRTYAWSAFDVGWSNPTVSGRAGWRPSAEWNVGMSGSGGAYLLPEAASTLPPGTDLGDFNQYTAGVDVSWSRHRWQVWSELFVSRFQVPQVGNADLVGGYVETKYKITPHLWAAGRMNVMLFGDVPDGSGGETRWDNNAWRLDVALGYRFNRHWQMKVQYSYGEEQSPGAEGGSLFAGQITVRF